MESEEKLVIFDKYPNALDANIIKGAIEASGIHAGVLGDSTANAIWMAPVSVVVFKRDLKAAIQAVYQGEKNYEDYQEEMDLPAFENMQACNKAFGELALKIHPEIGGKQYKDLYARAKDALTAGDLKTLNAINAQLPASVGEVQPVASDPVAEPKKIHGWLLLYLVLSVIIDVAAVVLLFTSSSSLVSSVSELTLFGFLVVAGCVMTGYLITSFMNRKPDAAFLGKHHVAVNFIPVLVVFSWILDRVENENLALLLYVLLGGYILVWRYFFGHSSQVEALIPSATRKVGKRERYLVTFLYAVIGLVFVFNYGLEKWWVALFAFWGVMSFSPLADIFDETDEVKPEE